MKSRSGAVAKLLFVDLAGSVVWFPVWWYTKGLAKVAQNFQDALRLRMKSYGFAIWIRNFFVPMYGQYDWTGRLVSVVMRFFVLIARSIALVVEALVYLLGLVTWALAPVAFATLVVINIAAGALHGV